MRIDTGRHLIERNGSSYVCIPWRIRIGVGWEKKEFVGVYRNEDNEVVIYSLNGASGPDRIAVTKPPPLKSKRCADVR